MLANVPRETFMKCFTSIERVEEDVRASEGPAEGSFHQVRVKHPNGNIQSLDFLLHS